ncbi:MAG: leucine-rich repeat domain-containing protein [Bacteroidales bacterium]|nr:leucine-rich repeat domain-containing protein [Bacteroidales bacterium]
MRKAVFIWALLTGIIGMSASAYDFKAISPSGHKVHYNIVSGNSVAVSGIDRTDTIRCFRFSADEMQGITAGYAGEVKGNQMVYSYVSSNNTYKLDTLTWHSQTEAKLHWERVSDSASFLIDDRYTSFGQQAYLRTYILAFMNRRVTGDDNGFMLMTMLAAHGSGNIHAWFELPPVPRCDTASLIDVRLTQMYRKYYDRCYIDYKIGDAWYAREINVEGIDVNINNFASVYAAYTMPAALAQQSSYNIRVRYKSADRGNSYGYAWAIDNLAFVAAKAQNNLTIPNSVAYGGHTYSVNRIEDNAFNGNVDLTGVSLPYSITSIGDGAFRGCKRLVGTLALPSSLTSIGAGAFNGCSGLSGTLTIPSSVTSIGAGAFNGCSGLSGTLTIPSSVTSIGASAFDECGFTDITIGRNVAAIGRWAFAGCSSITSISVVAGNTTYDSRGGCNAIIETSTNTLIQGCSNTIIPSGITTIGYGAFSGMRTLTGTLAIPNSVTTIDTAAFDVCTGLTGVTFGSGLVSIGTYAFDGCKNIGELTFTGLTPPTIGNYAFYGVSSTIPVWVPCISGPDYYSALQSYFINIKFSEGQMAFTAVSADNSKGSVEVITAPTCGSPYAVVRAVPSSGYHFLRWSTGATDNPLGVAVSSGTTITAYFEADAVPQPTQYTLTVVSADPSMGSTMGGGTYAASATVSIAAIPSSGYHFLHWQDGNTDNPRSITVTANATYTAYFEADAPTQYTLTVVSADPSMGSTMGGGTYAANATVSIAAIPSSGYHFFHWQDGNTDNPRSITVTANATYTAYFEGGVGIESREQPVANIYTSSGQIIVKTNEPQDVAVFDMVGKHIVTAKTTSDGLTLQVRQGVYLVKVGSNPAQKVVVVE